MRGMLQDLYDSEINFEISTFWGAGFDWKLGDEMNGYKDGGCCDTLIEVEEELTKAAIKYFSSSVFALSRAKENK